jgi:hypothetical protein
MLRVLGIAIVVLAVAVAPLAAQIRPNTAANDLKQIGLAYHNYNDANQKAPLKADDLGPYVENNKKLLDALKGGDYVFIYGVTPLQMTQGTSNTVLGYEKDTPTKGGYALYGDASVKKMTADEFKKAILAKKP